MRLCCGSCPLHTQVIDVVLNNLNGSSNNGDYRNISRTGSDPHPIHLHGHKFWVSQG
jgi:hypothetical protein